MSSVALRGSLKNNSDDVIILGLEKKCLEPEVWSLKEKGIYLRGGVETRDRINLHFEN